MVGLSLPVPPGFILGTDCGRDYLAAGKLDGELCEDIRARIRALGGRVGSWVRRRRCPAARERALGSARVHARDDGHLLNVGLTRAGARALANETGDEHFAMSSLERLLDSFATTVRGISRGMVEDALMDLGRDASQPGRAPSSRTSEICQCLLELIEEQSGAPFPGALEQLHEAIGAVFESWNSPRAKAYRKHKGIAEDLGTAVVVQRMVFGNRGADSASGVAFTRDPSTGAAGAYGDVLFDAQGEDVVAGERDTLPLADLTEHLPDAAAELQRVFHVLEHHTRDLCDIEFTIEQGKVWLLQTRVGQRSARAAVRLAVAFVDEGLISVEEALARVSEEQLKKARAPMFAAEPPPEVVLGRGLAASPGAVVGAVATSCEVAQERADRGEATILVRPTTSPADLPGVLAAAGVVTQRGGRASHAAVVARGLDKPAVCGVGEIAVEDGDVVSLDGDRGIIARGELELVPAEDERDLARFVEWHEAAARHTAG